MENNYDEKKNGKVIRDLYGDDKRAKSDISVLERWDIAKLLNRKITVSKPATYKELLPLWIGNNPDREVNEERIDEYKKYLVDEFGFGNFSQILKKMQKRDGGLTEASLSSLHNIAYVERLVELCKLDTTRPIKLLEIGAGCGFLIRDLADYSKYDYSFTLVDAVPESLAYAASFLSTNTKLHVELITADKTSYELSSDTCAIIPSWRVTEMPKGYFDVIINISSLQEVPDKAVEKYIGLIDKWLADNGGLFFANSRDFFYVREYQFPKNFKLLEKAYTPRSRTIDFPMEIFIKQKEDVSKENALIEVPYYIDLKYRAQQKQKKTAIMAQQLKTRLSRTQDNHKRKIEVLEKRHDQIVLGLEKKIKNLLAAKETIKSGYATQFDALRAGKAHQKEIFDVQKVRLVSQLNEQKEVLRKRLGESSKKHAVQINRLQQQKQLLHERLTELQGKYKLLASKQLQNNQKMRAEVDGLKLKFNEQRQMLTLNTKKIKDGTAKQISVLRERISVQQNIIKNLQKKSSEYHRIQGATREELISKFDKSKIMLEDRHKMACEKLEKRIRILTAHYEKQNSALVSKNNALTLQNKELKQRD